MEAQKRQVILLTEAPLGPYYHYCSQLANGLARRGDIDVRLLALFADTHRKQLAEQEACFLNPYLEMEILDPGQGCRLVRAFAFARALGRLLWSLYKNVDSVVHIHTPTGIPLFDVGLILALRLSGTSVVRTVHELTAAERFGPETRWQRWRAGLELRCVHHVVVHDQHTKRRLLRWFALDGNRISVIPHGNYLVFRTFAERPIRPAGQVMNGPPVILFHGVKRNKGIEVFLHAVELLRHHGASFRVLITGQVNPGDEDIVATLNAMKDVELDSRYFPSNELWRVFERADILAMPYLRGTTSGAVHLAFAFERPIVSSDLSCFDGLVIPGETGMIVARGDAYALATALEELIENKASLSGMGRAGYELTASEPFDWDKIAQSTIDAYDLARRKDRLATC